MQIMLDETENEVWVLMGRCQKQALTLILFALFSFTLFFGSRRIGFAGNDSN